MRLINWADQVRKAWGDEWGVPDTAYRFSGGREFRSSGSRGGVYTIPILSNLLIEPSEAPPDMHQATLLQEDGGALGQEA